MNQMNTSRMAPAEAVQAPANNVNATNTGGNSRKAQDIDTLYKGDSKKFGGEDDEYWGDFVTDYETAAFDHNLSAREKLQYMHVMLKGAAKEFFRSDVQGNAESFRYACRLMDVHYSTTTHKIRSLAKLQNLRYADILKSSPDPQHALREVFRTMRKLAPQALLAWRDDPRKAPFLKRALMRQNWASQHLKAFDTVRDRFDTLFNSLEQDLSFNLEEEACARADGTECK